MDSIELFKLCGSCISHLIITTNETWSWEGRKRTELPVSQYFIWLQILSSFIHKSLHPTKMFPISCCCLADFIGTPLSSTPAPYPIQRVLIFEINPFNKQDWVYFSWCSGSDFCVVWKKFSFSSELFTHSLYHYLGSKDRNSRNLSIKLCSKVLPSDISNILLATLLDTVLHYYFINLELRHNFL